MAFQDVSFPDNIRARSTAIARWRTDVAGSASGHEDRNSPWANARRRFEVSVPANRHKARESLRDFFHARRGSLYSFRFKDRSDYKSSDADTAVSNTDQTLGTGDGSTTQFQIVKVYDPSGPTPYTRDITKPVSGTLVVAVNGVAQTEGGGADYTVDYTTGVITFNTAPGSGLSVTAGYEFDVPVRFENDELPAEFLRGDGGNNDGSAVIEYRKITLIEVRE